MNTYEIVLKHLSGQHNQKRHGWRYGGLQQARRSMRGRDAEERSEYRKRAGMPTVLPKPGTQYEMIASGAKIANRHEWQKWANELAGSERSALNSYTSAGYSDINNFLRNGTKPENRESTNARIRAIDSALRKGKLQQNIELNRGFSNKDLYEKAQKGALIVGGSLIDKGFISTSTSRAVSNTFNVDTEYPIRLVIKAPKGTKGGYLPAANAGYGFESEFLLPRGTTFRIEGVTMDKSPYNDKLLATIEVIVSAQQ